MLSHFFSIKNRLECRENVSCRSAWLPSGPLFTSLLREGINNKKYLLVEKIRYQATHSPPRQLVEKNTSNIFWTQDHQWGTFAKKVIFPLEKLEILGKFSKI